jgi:hypothetical protein
MGLGRVELPTSRLSGVRSYQLSYRPKGITAHRNEAELYSNNSVTGCQGQNARKSTPAGRRVRDRSQSK